jgi:prolyl 4-hydroxylase
VIDNCSSHLTDRKDRRLNLPPIVLFYYRYQVDVSMPMHYANVSTNYAEYPWNHVGSRVPPPPEYKDMPVQPLGNRQAFYDEMIQGCVKYYGNKGHRCLEYEADRVEMTLRQPQSMENYTDMGFKKIRAPENVWKLIKEFWDRNKNDQSNENWPTGNTYSKYYLKFIANCVAPETMK